MLFVFLFIGYTVSSIDFTSFALDIKFIKKLLYFYYFQITENDLQTAEGKEELSYIGFFIYGDQNF